MTDMRKEGTVVVLSGPDVELERALDTRYRRVGPLRWDTAIGRVRQGENGDLILDSPDPVLEEELDKHFTRRAPGALAWLVADRTVLARVLSLTATVSRGKVSDEELAARSATCLGCPALIVEAEGFFCGACRCGRWSLARLDGKTFPKLRWRGLRCPVGKF